MSSGDAAIESVESVCYTPSSFSPSSLAGELAGDMTAHLVEQLLDMTSNGQASPANLPPVAESATGVEPEQVLLYKNMVEQLQAQLASSKSDCEELQALQRSEMQKNDLAQQTISGLQMQVSSLVEKMDSSQRDLTDVRSQLQSKSAEVLSWQRSFQQLEENHSKATVEIASFKTELELSRGRPTEREVSLNETCDTLQGQVNLLTSQLDDARSELAQARQTLASNAAPPAEAPEGEQQAALSQAYEQMAKMNTQISHLYADLTLARMEATQVKPGPETQAQQVSPAEVEKQNSQIADLVSDIRHLQLDLEYHQQKLDQLIEEKQQMMQELKKSHMELTNSRQQIEEKDQLLKHKEIDLARTKEAVSIVNPEKEIKLEEQLGALRGELASKDSALIVSHYELHKEKLQRDRLEQKNLKLMERLQKLMMVVEVQRKENHGLEKKVSGHERLAEEKEKQLRDVTKKAKQLQKVFRASKKTPRGHGDAEMSMLQGLPNILPTSPLDHQNSIDSARNMGGMPTSPQDMSGRSMGFA